MEGNLYCTEYNVNEPVERATVDSRWVLMELGVFVCSDCAEIHRRRLLAKSFGPPQSIGSDDSPHWDDKSLDAGRMRIIWESSAAALLPSASSTRFNCTRDVAISQLD